MRTLPPLPAVARGSSHLCGSVEASSDPCDNPVVSTSSAEAGLVRWRERPDIGTGELSPPSPALGVRLRTGAPITVLHAPAGFGKTFAMVGEFERLQAAGIRTGWVAGEALAVSGLPADDALAAVRTLLERADVVFLDDADRVSPTVLTAIATAMLYSSPGKRLVIGARRLDQLHISRRIAQGSAEVIGGDVLIWPRRRFGAIWQQRLSAAQIRFVHGLTEGWPAPGQMLARWLAAGGALDEAGLYLERSHVADYLEHEVLSALPESWLPTLAATSLHHEFDQELLDLLSPEQPIGRNEIAARLSTLISDGSGPTSRRYNRLLRRALRTRFERLPRHERDALLRLVADWAADRGDVVGAAHLASLAKDEQRIVDYTIRAGGLGLWLNKGYDSVKALVEVAGERLVRSEPRLQLLRCVVLLKDGRIGEADQLYRAATENLPRDLEAERDAALVRATLLVYGCRGATPQDDALFRRLSELCVDSVWKPLLPTLEAIRHSQQAEFGAAIAAIIDGVAHARAAGSSYPVMFLDFHAAGVALAQGALRDAAKVLARARRRWQTEFAEDQGAETVVSALSAQLDFERGRVRQAERHLKRSAHRLPHSEAWLDIYVSAFEPMMRLLGEEHGVAAAQAAIDRSRQQLRAQNLDRVADLLTGLAECMVGEAWLFDQAAPARSDPANPLPAAGKLATWQEREFGALAAAYRMLMAGEPSAACSELDGLVLYARDRGLTRTLQRALLLRTATLDRVGDPVAAQADFDEAVAIGRSTGLRRAFREFGGPSVADRVAALRANSDGAAEDVLLKGLVRSRLASAGEIKRLTRRERQILQELVVGGSDKTIARRLDVSEHAVRFHLKNVYAKLGVHNRAGAVSKQLLLTENDKKPTR